MDDYIYWVEVKGKMFNGKLTALNLDDFIKQIEDMYGNFSTLTFKVKRD